MASRTGIGIAERATSLACSGQVSQGYALLETAVKHGDPLAAAALAEWRLTGEFIRRDLRIARELYGRAAALGLAEAQPIYIALLANGAGGIARDWQRARQLLRSIKSDRLVRLQCELLDQMAIDENGDATQLPPSHSVSEAPPIEKIPHFLTSAECRYLIERAEPLLQPSVVVDPASGALLSNPVRTSMAAMFPFVLEDPVLHAINRRIAAMTGTRYDHGEPLQVLSYAPGQEYKLHSDALPPGDNQRVKTVLVYLSDDFDGGETAFPAISFAYRGAPGDALSFTNVDDQLRSRADARHAGLPVRRGRKLLLSKWIRHAPIDLAGPPGRPF